MNNEEITWDNLSPYNRMMIKTSLAMFIKEQQLDILCRACWDDDFIAEGEFLEEIEDYIRGYYDDKLGDKV